MPNCPSADGQDPTLYCAYFGGPRDGWKTSDLPLELSGLSLEGTVTRIPLSQPHEYSLFAVYECVGPEQVDGFWQFFFRGVEGPNGEQLSAVADTDLVGWAETVPDSPAGLLAPERVGDDA